MPVPAQNRGAVYLIDDGGNDWADVAATDITKISDSTGGISLSNSDLFGYSVAMTSDVDTGNASGRVIAIGVYDADTGGTDRGAVYILRDKNGDGDYADTGEKTILNSNTAGITLANE